MALDPVDVVGQRIVQSSQYNNPHDGPGEFARDRSSLAVQSIDMVYGPVQLVSVDPNAIYTFEWTNNGSVQDSQTLSVNKTTSKSFTWSMKEGLKISTKFKAKIPLVGESDTKVEVNLESTQSQTTTQAETWAYNGTVPVPPHKHVKVTFLVNEATYNAPFTASTTVRGNVYINFPQSNRYFQAEIQDLIDNLGWDPNLFIVHGTGTFDGIHGMNFAVNVDEHDAPSPAGQVEHEPSRGKSYTLVTGMRKGAELVPQPGLAAH
jgi:Clostridium epsilon toxin ETX/Bacillus mosquitocidal toxin MTX2